MLPAAGGNLLAGTADTDGQFCLIHNRVPPSDATPLHRHVAMDESFYVIAGSLMVTCGDDLFDVTAGGFVHLPRGLAHRYAAGPEGAEFLIHGVPAGLEHFFDDWEAGMDPTTAGRRHGIEFLS